MRTRREIKQRAFSEAAASVLLLSIGMTLLWIGKFAFVHFAIPYGEHILETLQAILLLTLAIRLLRRSAQKLPQLRPRLVAPTFPQILLLLLCALAGLLFLDDATLLCGALLQRLGCTVSETIAPPQTLSMLEYFTQALVRGILLSAGFELYFHAAQLRLWEHHGTAFSLLLTTLLGTFLCFELPEMPAQFCLVLAAGYIVTSTNCVFLAVFLRVLISVAAIAAQNVQAHFGLNAARFGRLWTEIGTKQGWLMLLCETALLGGMFLCLTLALCNTKSHTTAPIPRQKNSFEAGICDTFFFAVAIFTTAALLLLRTLTLLNFF